MKKICGIQWHHVRLLRHDLENWGWGRRPYFWDFGEREEAEERWNCSAQNCVFDSSSSNTKENRRHCFILMVNCKVREVRSNRVEIHAAIVHVFDSLPVEYFQRRIQCLQCWQSSPPTRLLTHCLRSGLTFRCGAPTAHQQKLCNFFPIICCYSFACSLYSCPQQPLPQPQIQFPRSFETQ